MNKKLMMNNDEVDDLHNDKQKYVSVINNNELYFYNDVNSESVLMLNKTLSDLSRQLLIAQITFDLQETPHIKLHINSDGGEVLDAEPMVEAPPPVAFSSPAAISKGFPISGVEPSQPVDLGTAVEAPDSELPILMSSDAAQPTPDLQGIHVIQ